LDIHSVVFLAVRAQLSCRFLLAALKMPGE